MAAASLIAVGTGAADSADVVVAAGTPVTVGLKGAAGPDVPDGCNAEIYLKGDDGFYYKLGVLTSAPNNRAVVLNGPGTYRVSRMANSSSCGVYSA